MTKSNRALRKIPFGMFRWYRHGHRCNTSMKNVRDIHTESSIFLLPKSKKNLLILCYNPKTTFSNEKRVS